MVPESRLCAVETPAAAPGPVLPARLQPSITTGQLRISLQTSVQEMNEQTWEVCFSFLTPAEVQRIKRPMLDKDRRLALGSALLQRAAIHWTFGVPYDDITIQRTPKGKPYFLQRSMRKDLENWNFNTSHHGEFVALATEPRALVGLDVVNLRERPRSGDSVKEFFRVFQKQLTHLEWCYVYRVSDEDARLERFHRLWALKEAFVKAIGSGFIMSPSRIEVVDFLVRVAPEPHDKIYVPRQLLVDGCNRPNWDFTFYDLNDSYVACLSHGPPSDAIPEYRWTLKMQYLAVSPPRRTNQRPFDQVSLRELIPAHKLAEFDASLLSGAVVSPPAQPPLQGRRPSSTTTRTAQVITRIPAPPPTVTRTTAPPPAFTRPSSGTTAPPPAFTRPSSGTSTITSSLSARGTQATPLLVQRPSASESTSRTVVPQPLWTAGNRAPPAPIPPTMSRSLTQPSSMSSSIAPLPRQSARGATASPQSTRPVTSVVPISGAVASPPSSTQPSSATRAAAPPSTQPSSTSSWVAPLPRQSAARTVPSWTQRAPAPPTTSTDQSSAMRSVAPAPAPQPPRMVAPSPPLTQALSATSASWRTGALAASPMHPPSVTRAAASSPSTLPLPASSWVAPLPMQSATRAAAPPTLRTGPPSAMVQPSSAMSSVASLSAQAATRTMAPSLTPVRPSWAVGGLVPSPTKPASQRVTSTIGAPPPTQASSSMSWMAPSPTRPQSATRSVPPPPPSTGPLFGTPTSSMASPSTAALRMFSTGRWIIPPPPVLPHTPSAPSEERQSASPPPVARAFIPPPPPTRPQAVISSMTTPESPSSSSSPPPQPVSTPMAPPPSVTRAMTTAGTVSPASSAKAMAPTLASEQSEETAASRLPPPPTAAATSSPAPSAEAIAISPISPQLEETATVTKPPTTATTGSSPTESIAPPQSSSAPTRTERRSLRSTVRDIFAWATQKFSRRRNEHLESCADTHVESKSRDRDN